MQGVSGSSPLVSTKKKRKGHRKDVPFVFWWSNANHLALPTMLRFVSQFHCVRTKPSCERGSHTPLEDQQACLLGEERGYIAQRAKSTCFNNYAGVSLVLTSLWLNHLALPTMLRFVSQFHCVRTKPSCERGSHTPLEDRSVAARVR